MAFKQTGSLNPHGAPILRRVIITDSVVSVVMDNIKVSAGFAALGTAAALTFGHLVAHSTEGGIGVDTSGAAGAATGSYVGTYTAASDNETVAKAKVECDISLFSLYTAELDGTIGATTGSDLPGYFADLIDENTIDETDTTTTREQYHLWGIAPDDSAKVLCNIAESSVFGV